MAIEIYAPQSYVSYSQLPKVFLAGSIDNGQAEDWQSWLVKELIDTEVVLLNPRRQDWNSTLEPEANNAVFREQVEWELAGLQNADLIVMYFSPSSKAPITLLELGLFASSGKLNVCCPSGYWRKGNVDIVCEQYGVSTSNTLDDLLFQIRALVA